MSAPTARETLDGVTEAYPGEGLLPAFAQILAARVEAVLALHKTDGSGREELEGECEACGEEWPCPTVRILDGEQP